MAKIMDSVLCTVHRGIQEKERGLLVPEVPPKSAFLECPTYRGMQGRGLGKRLTQKAFGAHWLKTVHSEQTEGPAEEGGKIVPTFQKRGRATVPKMERNSVGFLFQKPIGITWCKRRQDAVKT